MAKDPMKEILSDLGMEVNKKLAKQFQTPSQKHHLPFFNVSDADESTWKNDLIMDHAQLVGMDKIKARKGVARFPNIKDMQITTNPNTGRVVKLFSKWPDKVTQIAPFPDAIEEERQIRLHHEEFISLPDYEPEYDFYKALKSIEDAGPAAPQDAKQVIGYYVRNKTEYFGERDVWIIQVRGITPFLPGMNAEDTVPVDARNHIRNVVDAKTGEWLWADTIPQPIG